MKYKAVIIVISVIILSFSGLIILQKNKIKTGVKILLSQIHNSAWLYGDDYGYRYRLSPPLDYGTDNTKKFPLVVFLHGASERGRDNRFQIYDLEYLGAGGKRQRQQFQTKYPSFVYAPQCPADKTWNDRDLLAALTKTIDKLRNEYPIDIYRLHLIGYSMGGSGAYALAEQYYQASGHNFAGIIRLAGQSLFPPQTHDILSLSAVWLHVGMKDAPIRVQAAESAFAELKKRLPAAVESTGTITIKNHPGTTRTLTVNGEPIVKLSKYEHDGHAISNFPFRNPQLMGWLFARSSAKFLQIEAPPAEQEASGSPLKGGN